MITSEIRLYLEIKYGNPLKGDNFRRLCPPKIYNEMFRALASDRFDDYKEFLEYLYQRLYEFDQSTNGQVPTID